MPPETTKDRLTPDGPNMSRENTEQPRALTHDEKKAAEAAFRGAPFNPDWSSSAAKVYAGIISAMSTMQTPTLEDSDVSSECVAGR